MRNIDINAGRDFSDTFGVKFCEQVLRRQAKPNLITKYILRVWNFLIKYLNGEKGTV